MRIDVLQPINSDSAFALTLADCSWRRWISNRRGSASASLRCSARGTLGEPHADGPFPRSADSNQRPPAATCGQGRAAGDAAGGVTAASAKCGSRVESGGDQRGAAPGQRRASPSSLATDSHALHGCVFVALLTKVQAQDQARAQAATDESPRDNLDFGEAQKSYEAQIAKLKEDLVRSRSAAAALEKRYKLEQQLMLSAWHDLGSRTVREHVARAGTRRSQPKPQPSGWLGRQRRWQEDATFVSVRVCECSSWLHGS